MTKGSASKASNNKEEDSIVAHEAKPLKRSDKKLKQRSPRVLAAAEKEECVNAQVRADVSARNPGKVQAALTETRRGLSDLILEPLREEQYYEEMRRAQEEMRSQGVLSLASLLPDAARN
ncbi:hypothetical protein Droror1_Dr00025843 [Drosera rotundifolia]